MATVVSRGIHILNILGRPVMRIPPKQDVDLIEEIRLTVAGAVAGTSVDLAKLGANVVAMGANRIFSWTAAPNIRYSRWERRAAA